MTVRTATGNDDLDPYVNDIAGQVYNPDAQCERIKGTGSFLYRVNTIYCSLFHNVSRTIDRSMRQHIQNKLCTGFSAVFAPSNFWPGQF
jgi:hypothetical protein